MVCGYFGRMKWIAAFLLIAHNAMLAQERDGLVPSITDFETSSTQEFLQAGRDPVINAAAFEFSQAFFRLRGLDSRYGTVQLNGFRMNKMADNRPQWNNWGGLNDITREMIIRPGLKEHRVGFGGIGGQQTIDTDPTVLRPGRRVVYSSSNRSYSNRLMVSYIVPENKQGVTYAVSASRRWANSGYIDGTLYNAYGAYAAYSRQLGHMRLTLTGIYTDNRRGRSSAITEEVVDLLGTRYNPYWGLQDGKIRNSRERQIAEPLVMLNLNGGNKNFNWFSGLRWQWGNRKRSRLGYYNASNPDPVYYRNLPSFYVNSPIGADFMGAAEAALGVQNERQLNWASIYNTNQNAGGSAFYLEQSDVVADREMEAFMRGSINIGKVLTLDFRGGYVGLRSENYALIEDLLGADFHLDKDPFTATANDLDGRPEKNQGDKFLYHYSVSARELSGFLQARYRKNSWSGFVAGMFRQRTYQRDGLFRNARYPDNSAGKGTLLELGGWGLKSGIQYAPSGRMQSGIRAYWKSEIPPYNNLFINPRENHLVVPATPLEQHWGAEIELGLRMENLHGRITAYYNRLMDISDINFYFTETTVGSDFVQEVVTGLDTWHKGLEMGLTCNPDTQVKITAVALLGKHVFASDPLISLYVDAYGSDRIPDNGAVAGLANIKGKRLAEGPQQAYSLSITYNDPKYWWAGMSLNLMKHHYYNLSFLQHTPLFWRHPDTGLPAAPEERLAVQGFLQQKPFPSLYLVNLIGGKSWKWGATYAGVFLSVNNLLEVPFRTGGYTQGRNGNYMQFLEDQRSGLPSFAPKFWYGYGRTYFLNLTYSF